MTFSRTFALMIFMALVHAGLAGCAGSDAADIDPQSSPYFAQTDRMIDVDGLPVRIRQTGNTDGRDILLLHGFTDSLHTWDAVADLLVEDYNILRVDLPGHGLSGAPEDADYSAAAMTEHLDGLLRATELESPILVGNSLGGLAAWRYAAAHPDRVGGLVLLAPGGVPHNGIGDTPIPVPALLKLYLRSAPDAGVRTALEAMHADPKQVTDAMVTRYRDMMRVPGNADAFVARAEQFILPNPADDLQRITAPTIILWGAQDGVLPFEQAETFESYIPHAEIVRLPDVGHMPQSEAPERVADAIRTLADWWSEAP